METLQFLSVFFVLLVIDTNVNIALAGPKKARQQTATCRDGMDMVKRYLETSKIELIKNIREAKAHTCRLQAWRKVTPSMISHTHVKGVTASFGSDPTGGLKISATVNSHGCGKGPGSTLIAHIKGHWKQIMYTQVFKGSTSCWGIFGNDYDQNNLGFTSGLEPFNPTMNDIIFGQKKMQSTTVDSFKGATKRCDNAQDNFWHGNNGQGERQATVMLRRRKGARHAGIQTGTSCGTPTYEIKDIYVLM